MRQAHLALFFAAALASAAASAATTSALQMNVLVDGSSRPEYSGRGNVYVEAVRGREYAIRLTNPSPYRIAVALSVDGLNTIDARHTAAWEAAKWVLQPYESAVISGWQVSRKTARRFYFTGERDSYGAAIGHAENLGVIEAVAFRENVVEAYTPRFDQHKSEAGARRDGAVPPAAQSPSASVEGGLSDEYAGTGMGDRTRHSVRSIDIELNPNPIGSIRLRYEFGPQLVKLGILPSFEPLDRREHARGFSSYCPEP